MSEPDHYDELEIRAPDERERELFLALPAQIAHAQAQTTAYAELLHDVDPDRVIYRDALSRLPITRKSELIELQEKTPPFGGFVADEALPGAKVFASPGPLYEPEGDASNYWRLARACYAAGFRAGDLVHNTFSYHFTPAGSMLESGARALGCTVFPAGTGNTELQAQTLARLCPQAYTGTPSFLKILLEKVRDLGLHCGSLTKALVSGEALPPSLRADVEALDVHVLQCYATADLGLIAYESPAKEGMIIDEELIAEIVRPGTGDPVPDGEVGEVVVTTFNKTYPLIRFATGDLSAVMSGISPCGRTNMRIKGWMGRADQATKVKGMFVHPSQVDQVLKRHPEVFKGRLVVMNDGTKDQMTLFCEVKDKDNDALRKAINDSLREVSKVKGQTELVAPGSLANDGKVIDDVRTYT
ncbi:MAG: AMP-binding protein [Gammaproteobacteria bacterium]|nr:AMP-binding protein [Gammaproteobacteria bacterium]